MTTGQERPAPPPLPTAKQVPVELRTLKRWVGWRAQWDESKGKWRKPPCSPVTGEAIGAVPKWAEHWLTFEEALAGAERHALDGVGLVFTGEDGLVGVDFDDCRDEGVLRPEVESWLRWLPSYAEVSPSGAGVHVIARGRIPKAVTAQPLPNGDGATVEMYATGRYFTFTGQSLIDSPITIRDCQVGIDKLKTHLLGTIIVATSEEQTEHGMSKLTARRLHADNLEALRHAAQGEGNALLNTAAFFAGRAAAAGALEQTEGQVKAELLRIVTQEWADPHPEAGARATVDSGWASGASDPLKLVEDEFPEILEAIEKLNGEGYYFVTNFGGKNRVCYEENSRTTLGNSFVLVPMAPVDFEGKFRKQLITVGLRDDGSPILKNKAKVWMDHPSGRQYDKVVFEPNVKTPAEVRNLWRGFAFEPKQGDCSLYLEHLKEHICRSNLEKYNYLLGWMAYAVRHPNEQGHAAVVIQGHKGVGKNVAAEGFATLWGGHALVVSDSTRITNNFNAHLRSLCVLIADEAFFAGDRRHEGKLKSLITGSVLDIEAKGVDVVQVKNLLHIIILGNDRWLVPATADERRFLALNCSDKKREDQAYFGEMLRRMKDGGYAGLLWYLMEEVDLTNFNVRNVPHTKELRDQMAESLRGVDAAWFRCLHTGILPGRLQADDSALMKSVDLINWAARNGSREWMTLKPQHVGALLGEGKVGDRGMGFYRQQTVVGTARQRFWVIPQLHEARSLWDKLRFEYDWPEDGGEWDTVESEDSKF